MTHSKYTNQIVQTHQRSSRGGHQIKYFQLHHMASTDGPGVVRMMTSGAREVSANYAVYSDGTAVCVVDEDLRAWTSGTGVQDSEAITFEIANDNTAGWSVSPASHEKVAMIIADAAKRYGIPITRDRIYGHNEMTAKFGTSYATACPGGLNIDWIVNRANQITNGASASAAKETPLVATPAEINQIVKAIMDAPQPRMTTDGKSTGKFDNIGGVLRYEYSKYEALQKQLVDMQKQLAAQKTQTAEVSKKLDQVLTALTKK
ncbi:peptidoglycan recognition protein family protein [Lysinibacter cavernae]|uniref:N-acetylmuramoyl-L-alanine amidase n=1 Tax=Lysinibacter cavernae TaxID=1640652 RepID=A0A7X5QZ57_9MICO|nr:peptidoglycan recognition family protein [Lysinibacter cavernae]NIH52557.1 N-acetyl-anhydromuramyl-L-alanine amidase AmpD [Lysinibacter cavernae]